ncbi:putative DNA-binding transcriptional regulator YafY [Streptomyces canus]|nr:putative DNA-binding transcriptional regulator YafY [Streptomyces canus]
MLETSARLLRLLSLLQAHRDWSGADLAERLGVTPRTVRRDVDRLRELGYPVNASPGTGGGYQLGAGAELPPLLLDDDEAVAVAVGLRTAAGQGIEGIGETSVRALAKLEQVLPSRLRRRVGALNAFTVPMLRGPQPSAVDPAVLTELAHLCRDAERLRFAYRSHNGDSTRRTVEPHRLVCTERRWYLVAWDLDRDDWRTFRVDRITPKPPHGPRFTPRTTPGRGPGRVRLPGRLHARVRGAGRRTAPGAPGGGRRARLALRGATGGRRTGRLHPAHRGREPRCDGDPRDADGLRVRGAGARRADRGDQDCSGPACSLFGSG